MDIVNISRSYLPDLYITSMFHALSTVTETTLLAQTWDLEVFEEAGDIVGEEMEELGVSLWLAPGMNIHRNPLCGRNFEYYSEDPVVSGMCVAGERRIIQI